MAVEPVVAFEVGEGVAVSLTTVVLAPRFVVELPDAEVRSPDPFPEPSTSSPHPAQVSATSATRRRFLVDTPRLWREVATRARADPRVRIVRVMLFYKSSDMITILSSVIEERGETWRDVTLKMGRCGRSFYRQLQRTDPNPSGAPFFKCLRVVELEMVGCRHLHELVALLDGEREGAGLSYRQLAEMIPFQGCHRTVTRALLGRTVPRLDTLLVIACVLNVHPELAPPRSRLRRRGSPSGTHLQERL